MLTFALEWPVVEDVAAADTVSWCCKEFDRLAEVDDPLLLPGDWGIFTRRRDFLAGGPPLLGGDERFLDDPFGVPSLDWRESIIYTYIQLKEYM